MCHNKYINLLVKSVSSNKPKYTVFKYLETFQRLGLQFNEKIDTFIYIYLSDTWHLKPDMWHMTHDMWHVENGGR